MTFISVCHTSYCGTSVGNLYGMIAMISSQTLA
jgi:hypothetical protein